MEDVLSFEGVRTDSLSRVWVDTRHTIKGFEELDALVRTSRTQNTAFSTCLIGPPRCGKSTLIKEYLRKCRDRVAGRLPLKFLWVELEQNTRSRNIATLTLHALGDPSPSRGDATQRALRVVEAIRRGGYDLIVYDEAHHLLGGKSYSVQDDGVAFLNGLLNKAKCPIVLVGYEQQVRSAIHRNASLAGRLWPSPVFQPYNLADQDDLMELRFVLREFERFMGFPTPSNLHNADTAARICYVCCGKFGHLEIFLEYSRDLAKRREHSCLTNDDLRDAAEAVGPMNRPHWTFNPFTVGSLSARLTMRRLRASRRFSVPGRKGRSLDARASGQGPDAPGAEKRRWTDPSALSNGHLARQWRWRPPLTLSGRMYGDDRQLPASRPTDARTGRKSARVRHALRCPLPLPHTSRPVPQASAARQATFNNASFREPCLRAGYCRPRRSEHPN